MGRSGEKASPDVGCDMTDVRYWLARLSVAFNRTVQRAINCIIVNNANRVQYIDYSYLGNVKKKGKFIPQTVCLR